jgi:hypothetical protein
VAFYAGYDIPLRGNTDMSSELRAAGVNLGVLGMMMLAGVTVTPIRPPAVAAGLVVFCAYPAGRLLSIAADGWPSEKVLLALLVELVIAALCLVAFVAGRGGSSRPCSAQRKRRSSDWRRA